MPGMYMRSMTKTELAQYFAAPQFPRASAYDPQWILDNQMGPNALWLTEWLCQKMELRPGMRVLDLGCGRALSSIFLAREYGVHVWATDLWIGATENLTRIEAAGVTDHVFPIHSDARTLPYAEGYFDAITCVDAYIYFGTDDLYLDYLQRFVKPGGQIGMVVPGFMQDVDGDLPAHLIPFWAQECWTWHTAAWWQRLWSRTGLVSVEVADTMPDGAKLWLQWKRARWSAGEHTDSLKSDIDVLEADAGRHMGWVRMVGAKHQ
jgi:cyclopropane fatty-acyl-phospholipid synthase-like methyltransferase